MGQRFEDNLIKAITTSNIQLLKNTLESSERTVHWNQTLDGISVLALCVKFFDPQIIETLYPSSIHTCALPNDLFGYIVEHGPQNMVDTFAVNIIATINDKVNFNNIWGDDSDAEQTLESLKNTSPYISALVNNPTCNLIEQLLQEKNDPKFLSLLLIKSVEWGNQKLLKHAIEQITQKDSSNWEGMLYKDWNAAHVQHIQCVYTSNVNPTLNDFLDHVSPNIWGNHTTAHQTVLLYSSHALKDLLNNEAHDTTQISNIPQKALDRLSMEGALKEFTTAELETLLEITAGRTIEQYGFLSSTPMHFEIALILEQYKRIYLGEIEPHWKQKQDQQQQRFYAFCTPLLSSIPYAFLEKRMDLELYYRSIHDTAPNQSVSVLDCLYPTDRAWAENHLLHQQINKGSAMVGKKSKI